MPVEFALRPRIRLREKPAPAPRVRARLPKFALPALGYWLVIGGLVYEFVQHHQPSASLSGAEAALTPPAAPPTVRAWWRPLPPPIEPISTPPREPEAPTPEAPTPEAPAPEAPAPEAPLAVAALEAPVSEPEPQAEPQPQRRLAEPPLAARSDVRKHAPLASLPRDAESADVPVPTRTSGSDPVDLPAPALPAPPSPANSLPSCEGALASANQDVDFSGGNRTADLPTQAIAAVLENGAWLSACTVPERTALEVCVAIQGGRVIGASVSSRPSEPALDRCVKRRASSLRFPYSPHLDLARTRF